MVIPAIWFLYSGAFFHQISSIMKPANRFHRFFPTLVLVFATVLPAMAQNPTDTFSLTACNYFWKTGESVPGLFIGADNMDPSDVCGTYLFSPAALVDGFCPQGVKDSGDYVNGVTVADIVILVRHILGFAPISSSSYLYFAADVNKSNSITTFDIIESRKLILGIYSELPNNVSWRSLSEYQQTALFQLLCTYDYDPNLTSDTIKMIAFKIGDLDGDANPDGLYSVPQTYPPASLFVPDTAVNAGDTILAPVYFSPASKLYGLQVGFHLTDTSLGRILPVNSGSLPWVNASSNYGVFQNGVNFIWFTQDGYSFQTDTQPLFFLKIVAEQPFQLKDALKIWPDVTPALWVDENVQIHPFSPSLTTAVSEPDVASVVRVSPPSPNPFKERTNIQIELKNAGHTRLEVLDIAGQLLWRQEKYLNAGSHTLEIPGDAMFGQNVAVYRISVGAKNISGKLLRL